MKKILSIHWGLSLGGVAKYAATIERVSDLYPLHIKSFCILPEGRIVDRDVLAGLDATEISLGSVFDLSWISRVRRTIAVEKPDCVLSHGFNGHLVALIGCWGRGASIGRLASYHGSYHATTLSRRVLEPIYNGFTHWYMRNKATNVLSVAGYCADFLAKRNVNRSKLTVVHNGIHDYVPADGVRKSIRASWGVDSGDLLIGVASRLDPVKGVKYLVRAFANITGRYRNVRLVVIGDGAVRNDLEREVRDLAIENRVIFAGMRTDVPDCLATLDVFALPSLAEYHSIGLLEAMRAGLPIVATDVGGNTESVRHDAEGIIVRPASVDDLVSGLDRLLSDKMLRDCLGKAARNRFLEEFTEEVMLARTADWMLNNCGLR